MLVPISGNRIACLEDGRFLDRETLRPRDRLEGAAREHLLAERFGDRARRVGFPVRANLLDELRTHLLERLHLFRNLLDDLHEVDRRFAVDPVAHAARLVVEREADDARNEARDP